MCQVAFRQKWPLYWDATGRAVLDEEEGDTQLFVAPTAAANEKLKNKDIAKQKKEEIKKDQENFIDLDDMLGGMTATPNSKPAEMQPSSGA